MTEMEKLPQLEIVRDNLVAACQALKNLKDEGQGSRELSLALTEAEMALMWIKVHGKDNSWVE